MKELRRIVLLSAIVVIILLIPMVYSALFPALRLRTTISIQEPLSVVGGRWGIIAGGPLHPCVLDSQVSMTCEAGTAFAGDLIAVTMNITNNAHSRITVFPSWQSNSTFQLEGFIGCLNGSNAAVDCSSFEFSPPLSYEMQTQNGIGVDTLRFAFRVSQSAAPQNAQLTILVSR